MKELKTEKQDPGLTHTAVFNISNISAASNGFRLEGVKTIDKQSHTIVKAGSNESPLLFSFLEDVETKKPSEAAVYSLFKLVASKALSNIKSMTGDELIEFSGRFSLNLSEMANEWGQNRLSVYRELDKMARELRGVCWWSERLNAFIPIIDQYTPTEGYIIPSLSVKFLDEIRQGGFVSLLPKKAFGALSSKQGPLAIYLFNISRAQYVNAKTAPDCYRVNVETIFKSMNRPTKAPNREEKKKLQRPFIKTLKDMAKHGFFTKMPFFSIKGTKNEYTLEEAYKLMWCDVLKLDLVYFMPPPAPEETRNHHIAFLGGATPRKNQRRKDKPTGEPTVNPDDMNLEDLRE
ncbi:MAG: hypothetical protein HUK20_11050 [Fibrobacter sp.]|nr:hypothetical protein [Fibrobacter sp.]